MHLSYKVFLETNNIKILQIKSIGNESKAIKAIGKKVGFEVIADNKKSFFYLNIGMILKRDIHSPYSHNELPYLLYFDSRFFAVRKLHQERLFLLDLVQRHRE